MLPTGKPLLLASKPPLLVFGPLPNQITALIFLPTFPGWLAPLHFNPDRFSEFAGFAATLVGTWVATGLLTGGYRTDATADLGTAISRVSRIWLVSMPVSAAQLVLVTALEGRSLVGAQGFADVLPLAASGAGEPFVTAAGVLGESLGHWVGRCGSACCAVLRRALRYVLVRLTAFLGLCL